MRITVAGIGYVGLVTAACLARMGHRVIAVDVVPAKVRAVNHGKSPVSEPGLSDLIRQVTRSGALRASEDLRSAVQASELTIVCVGTPSQSDGDLDTSHVLEVTHEIGDALSECSQPHTIVYRSTMLPGTTEGLLIPAIEARSGKPVGDRLGVTVNPEFLREGSALADFTRPARTIVGGEQPAASRVLSLYEGIEAPSLVVSIKHAEMTKYVDNSWHALKVAFANEVGSLCKATGLDSHVVMESFLLDDKLNISPAYLKPGFAFGGSCLPKDLRAIHHRGNTLNLDLPLLSSIIPSNEAHLARIKEIILAEEPSHVGLLGLAFKSDTDDLRESPALALTEWLIDEGFGVSIFDANLSLEEISGANLHELVRRIPDIAHRLELKPEAALLDSDLVVLASMSGLDLPAMRPFLAGKTVIDLIYLDNADVGDVKVVGVCW